MSRLIDGFDALVCDLDGVVITGRLAVPHAVASLNALPVPVVYATNNASRTPTDVSHMLQEHGVRVQEDRVLTSSLAAARELAAALPPGSPVLAIGGPGVAACLEAVGLRPCSPDDSVDVVAVVQGYGRDVTAADLGAAAHAIQTGARWVATNTDQTLPTERGPAPGNGSLVAAVRGAVDVDPLVIGKPNPPIYALAAAAVGANADRTLAVGDRLNTDIAGARAAGMAAALVLTGVHGPEDAAGAPAVSRPTHVIEDLRALTQDYPEPVTEDEWFVRADARARCGDGLEVEGTGIDAVRAALDAVWAAVDAGRITHEEGRSRMANR